MSVGLTVRDTDPVIDRVNGRVVAIGDGLTDPVIDRVNGRVVAIGETLLVSVVDFVRLTDVVRVIVPEGDFVPTWDAGTVKGGERVILRDFVRLGDTVGVIERVKGLVVAIGEPLLVSVVDLVILRDVVRVIVPEGDFVPTWDAGTVKGGERVILRDFVRLGDTVGVIERVNGLVVAIGELLLVSVVDLVILRDVVRVIVPDGDFVPTWDAGIVKGGERLLVRLTDCVRVIVADGDLVPKRDAGTVAGGEPLLVSVVDFVRLTDRVRVIDVVGDFVPPWDA